MVGTEDCCWPASRWIPTALLSLLYDEFTAWPDFVSHHPTNCKICDKGLGAPVQRCELNDAYVHLEELAVWFSSVNHAFLTRLSRPDGVRDACEAVTLE